MNVRPIVREDSAALAAIIRADEEALRGRPSHIESRDLEMWWSRTDLAHESWLFEERGVTVAAGWFSQRDALADVAGIVAQGAKGRGLGTALVERGEALARERKAARIHTWVMPEDPAANELFGTRGYREVRRFFEMTIELVEEPSVPVLPPPLVLDGFREGDAHAFHAAMVESFQDHWEWYGPPFDEWWRLRAGDDHSLWFVVRDGEELAAVVRNEVRDSGGYVGLLGVRRAWRGRGLGKALLHRTFGEVWRRGQRRVSLEVDAESPTGATKLYESVGMHVALESAVFEKTLS